MGLEGLPHLPNEHDVVDAALMVLLARLLLAQTFGTPCGRAGVKLLLNEVENQPTDGVWSAGAVLGLPGQREQVAAVRASSIRPPYEHTSRLCDLSVVVQRAGFQKAGLGTYGNVSALVRARGDCGAPGNVERECLAGF